jgi:hypothetical protein
VRVGAQVVARWGAAGGGSRRHGGAARRLRTAAGGRRQAPRSGEAEGRRGSGGASPCVAQAGEPHVRSGRWWRAGVRRVVAAGGAAIRLWTTARAGRPSPRSGEAEGRCRSGGCIALCGAGGGAARARGAQVARWGVAGGGSRWHSDGSGRQQGPSGQRCARVRRRGTAEAAVASLWAAQVAEQRSGLGLRWRAGARQAAAAGGTARSRAWRRWRGGGAERAVAWRGASVAEERRERRFKAAAAAGLVVLPAVRAARFWAVGGGSRRHGGASRVAALA